LVDGPATGSAVPDPERSADVENTMLAVLVLGTHLRGIDVSVDPRGWQRMRPCPSAFDAFKTVNGTGVSAGGRRT
jgi:hypothetical protein